MGSGAPSTGGRRQVGAQVAAFMYHDVTDTPGDSGFVRRSALAYKHTRHDFLLHLNQIAASPARPVIVLDVDLQRPGRYLLLTFDDGGKSALYVGDELCRRGWRGHFFVTTAYVGKSGFLDQQGLRYLQSCGHLIGSHSHTHPGIFRDLSPAQMTDEWRISRDIISSVIGENVVAASVPGGDISTRVLRSAAHCGFRYLFTSEPEMRPRMYEDCWIIGRVAPRAGVPVSRVKEWARFEGWSQALIVRRFKVALKLASGPLYRLYVRRTGSEPPAVP